MSAAWTQQIDWHQFHTTLCSLPKGQRKPYALQVADGVGKSVSQVYRERAKRFGPLKTIDRPITVATDEDLRAIAEIKESYNTITLKGTNRELSTDAAIELAEDEGLVEKGKLKRSTVNTGLRERVGYRDETPRVRVEARYACQQFQIDFSRSKHFQVVEPTDDGDWLLRVSAKELHYKSGSERLRTWVTQIVDEYSRLRHIVYRSATGEDTLLGLSALGHVFNREEDDHMMRHLPDRLKGDNGAFMKSRITLNFLDALDIDPKRSAPENKESQGKVERGFRTQWQRFEAPLATRLIREQGVKATITLSELNRLVHRFTVAEHNQTHPVYRKERRGDMYQQSILQHRPRILGIDVRDIAFQVWERKADSSGLIYLNGVPFEVPQFAYGKHVRIFRNVTGDFSGSLIDGYRDEPFNVRPFRFRDLDDFDGRAHRTFAQEMRSQAEQTLQATTKRLMPAAQMAVPTTPILQARAAAEMPNTLSALEAAAELGRALGQQGINPAYYDISRYVYDGITRAELDDLVHAVLSTNQRKAV